MKKLSAPALFLALLLAWFAFGANTSDSFSGEIVMMASGSCPMGFTESSALNGSFPRGTINANADVGGTGGSDTITPAGTVSTPTFAGAQGTTSAVSAGTPAGSNGTASLTSVGTKFTTSSSGTYSFTTLAGTASAASPTVTVPAETFTGASLATHTHTLTPSGTVSTPTFAGTQFDNRPTFVKVIFCVKN